ncbi:MAG: glycosyltransferase family 4 protein [Acidobacteriota bacterium]
MGARPRVRVGLLTLRADLYGGGQRSLRDLAAALVGGRVDPVVILPGPGPLADALVRSAVPLVPLALPPLRPASLLRSARALRRLAGEVRDRRLDLLHSQSPRAALYAGLASRWTGVRHVWHLRAAREARWITDRLLLGLCDAVISVSRAAALRSPALRASRRVRVLPTGIPPVEPLARDRARGLLGLPRGGFIAGIVGRVEPDKGGLDAVAALPAIRRAVPGAMLAFLGPEAVGTGWVRVCRERAAAAGVADAVLFLGERPEAASLLPAFDLILHPSLHEALPRVLIEAQFSGLPVVAAAVGGVPELIEPGRSGLLVPPGRPEALAAAVATLAGDPGLARRLAEEGARRARALFGVDRMARGVAELYLDLIGAAAGAAAYG